jgi:hypothetical protein
MSKHLLRKNNTTRAVKTHPGAKRLAIAGQVQP